MFTRKSVSLCLLVLVAIMALTGCAAPAAQQVEKVVTQVVEKPVEKVVTQSVVITATPAPEQPKAQPGAITMNGAGATFPFPLYSRWFYDYAFVDPAVKFNYQSIGSGGGIKQITAKTVDFGASDAILNDDQYKAAPGIQMLPTVAGAVVPVYNVKELNGLKDGLVLDSQTLADIFLGKITKWNDPAIVKLNSAMTVTLPSQGYRGRPSLGWLRHELHLHRLPVVRQRRVEDQGRQEHLRASGRSAWAARATRAWPAP